MKIEGISKPGQLLTAQDIIVTEGDKKLNGLASAAIYMDPDSLVEVRLKLQLENISLSELKSRYVVRHPVTGELKEVADVKLKDGTMLFKDGVLSE